MVCTAFLVLAATPSAAAATGWCWDDAAKAQAVSPDLLRAIAAEESSCKPLTGAPNADGSVDHGYLGINSSWLRDARFRRLGVSVADLYEPCKATYIAAWVLATCFRDYGVTWRGVGCYNAKSFQKQIVYANKVHARLQRYYRTGKGLC
jgi:hypothetical protein